MTIIEKSVHELLRLSTEESLTKIGSMILESWVLKEGWLDGGMEEGTGYGSLPRRELRMYWTGWVV